MDVDTSSELTNASVPPTTSANNPTEVVKEEEEEEEFLIMAEIGHDIDQQTVLEHASKSEIRAINIDGPNPFVQIGPYTFQGQYNYTLGTNLFFSTASGNADDNASTSSRVEEATPSAAPSNDLHVIGSSDKKLSLSRVYIYPKKNDEPSNS